LDILIKEISPISYQKGDEGENTEIHSISMVNLESVKERYGRYDWGERHRWVRYLSVWLLIFGNILIIAGVVLSVLLITGRIALPYASGTRVLVTVAVLILGLLLGSGLLAMSRVLCMVLDVERNTRYAMNIWFILEEKDLSEESNPTMSSAEYPPIDEDPSCL
jgi:small-conductance mechanosensitive channel